LKKIKRGSRAALNAAFDPRIFLKLETWRVTLFYQGTARRFPVSNFEFQVSSFIFLRQFLQIPSMRISILSMRPGKVRRSQVVSIGRLAGLRQSICPQRVQ
jgi:hypothetical protein